MHMVRVGPHSGGEAWGMSMVECSSPERRSDPSSQTGEDPVRDPCTETTKVRTVLGSTKVCTNMPLHSKPEC